MSFLSHPPSVSPSSFPPSSITQISFLHLHLFVLFCVSSVVLLNPLKALKLFILVVNFMAKSDIFMCLSLHSYSYRRRPCTTFKYSYKIQSVMKFFTVTLRDNELRFNGSNIIILTELICPFCYIHWP